MHKAAATLLSGVPALTALALVLPLMACKPAPATAPPPQSASTGPEPAPEPTVLPAAPQTLDRAALLEAMNTAAATYAAGADPTTESLVGRRFAVRQAFGCSGPVDAPATPAAGAASASGDGLARAVWRGDRETIELSLTPGEWTGSALVSGAAADWEAVEGIWLQRPWLPVETCPDLRIDPLAAGPVAPAIQTMGLAAVFEAGGSRLGQRKGRAYSFVVRGRGGQPPAPPPGGYRLVMEGRMVAFLDGQPVHCRAASPDQRPVCIAAGRLDRVAFEDAAGTVLSEWRPG